MGDSFTPGVPGREGLEEALREFGGGALVISHDRQFLETVTDRVVYLADGRLQVFHGGLEQCLEALATERQQRGQQRAKERGKDKKAGRPREKPRAGAQGKVRNPLMFKKLEEQIFAMEERVETLRQDMISPENYNDHKSMQRLQAEERALVQELQDAYERWENWESGS